MLTEVITLGFSIVLILLTRPITTLIHELGHAIPSLIFTDEEVIICIGSYGDVSKSLALKLGRLTIFFKINILEWFLGLCAHSNPKSFVKQIIIVLGGPAASLMLGLILIYYVSQNDLSDGKITIISIFIISTILDFFINIIPVNKALYLFNGDVIYNDGNQLLKLIKQSRLPQEYFTAEELHLKKENYSAVQKLNNLIQNNHSDHAIVELLIKIYMDEEQYDQAIDLIHQYRSGDKLTPTDNARMGEILFKTKSYEKALNYFNDALYFDYTNAFYLNKRGLINEKLDDEQAAIKDYYAALNYNEGMVDPYVNLAAILLRKEEYDNAKQLLEIALKLNDKHPSAHFFMGKLLMKRNEDKNALLHFNIAEKLGSKEHGLDFYIANLSADIDIRETKNGN